MNGGRATTVSKGLAPPGTGVQLPRQGGVSGAVHTAGLANFPNAGALGQNQMFPPHLQHLQQMQSQHIRAEQQRNMLAAVAGHGATSFAGGPNFGPNSLTPQQVQNHALAAAMGSAGLTAGRTGGASRVPGTGSLAGVDGLNHPRLPPQFNHQRENVEASSRGTKR